jgi:hypothetical protein
MKNEGNNYSGFSDIDVMQNLLAQVRTLPDDFDSM